MTIIDDETWNKFRRHCLSQQQLNPESTIPETIRKLRFLEKQGINLEYYTKDHIFDHFAKRLENGATYSALNHYVKALNRWNKFQEKNFQFNLYKEETKTMKVPTTAEINRMLQECKSKNRCDKRNKTMILLLAKTGMRNKELCNLKLSDIDWQRQEITIRKSKHNKTRIIPVEEKMFFGRTYPSLKNYIQYWRINSCKHFIFTTAERRMTSNYLRRIIKEIGKKAGMSWIHPHSFRHYAATNMLRAGVNIRIVQEILGHRSIKTTGRYLHTIERDLQEAVRNPRIEDPINPSNLKNITPLEKSLLMMSDGPAQI